MNLVSFSIQTKGLRNFTRRLWTVFARFGISETKTRRALYELLDSLRKYNAAPTFYIPAVVLLRHSGLIKEIARRGAEIGIHGYVHNDYRSLNKDEQYRQTYRAIGVFDRVQLSFQGFRNPYLGWTEESLHVFKALGLTYESNEAVLHDVIDLHSLSPMQRSGYEKSLALFRALPCNSYTLRPHFEGTLLRIPTSIPDDEMLFDRLRITDPEEVGRIWCKVMQSVYESGGLYTLNLHPERGVCCKRALEILLDYAHNRVSPIWLARVEDIAEWWKERSQFRWDITPLTANHWSIEASCTARATVFARHLTVDYQSSITSSSAGDRTCNHRCVVQSRQCPCIALSPRTPEQVMDFLFEQGYPVVRSAPEDAHKYSLYLDLPAGLGATREEQLQQRSALVRQLEQLDAPLFYFGCWPGNYRAALAISGDIDSVTIQDFFLRVLEVS